MAIMWPAELPVWILRDERRAAEIKVWKALHAVLDQTWSVFYSRPWWGLNEKGGEIDGEADFIVCHPGTGFLFIEVKGGGVSYDPATSQWRSVDRYDIPRNIKDPVQQAVACKHRYIDRLKDLDGWPHGYVRFRHGVILTDSSAPGRGALTVGGYEKKLFCFAEDFDKSLGEWVKARLAAHEVTGSSIEVAPGDTGVGLLTRLVADPVRLRVPMRRKLQSDLERIDELATGAQMHAIALLDSVPRALVEGGAGTGKTILAMEMAARLSDAGRSVCLLCYNDPLAAHMRHALSERPGIRVETFHAFCGSIVREAGVNPGPVGPDFYSDRLPACAVAALGKLPDRRWDAVIVDEGQDFDESWWKVVDAMNRGGESGVLRVFLDVNQSVYASQAGLAERLNGQGFPLRMNLRNTKAIARVTDGLYTGPQILAAGPEGEPPSVDAGTFSMALECLYATLVRLRHEEGLGGGDIAVLCPMDAVAKQVRAELGRMRIATCPADARQSGSVTVDTIRRFKGLEAPVVILVTDRQASDSKELAYVGVSRAQSRLFVIGDVAHTTLGNALALAMPSSPTGSQ